MLCFCPAGAEVHWTCHQGSIQTTVGEIRAQIATSGPPLSLGSVECVVGGFQDAARVLAMRREDGIPKERVSGCLAGGTPFEKILHEV